MVMWMQPRIFAPLASGWLARYFSRIAISARHFALGDLQLRRPQSARDMSATL
jgi:HAMP domain-containing protein